MLPAVLEGAATPAAGPYTTIEAYYNTGNKTREKAALALEQAIENLDINGDGVKGDIAIDVKNIAWADYLGQLQDRDKIPCYFLGWGPDYADPDDYVVPFLGGNVGGTYAYWNSYNNSNINNWIGLAQRTADKASRLAYYQQMEAQAAQDVAYVPLYQAYDIRVERDEVNGYAYNPMVTSPNDLFFMLSKTAATGTPVNTIVKEEFGGPQYLDPGIDYENAGGEVIQNIYETLITYKDYTKPDEFSPLLAAKMPVWNTAGDEATIALRTGVTFHDGTPFNASCVKYSFDRAVIVNDPDGPNWMWGGFAYGGATYMGSNGTAADVMDFIYGEDRDPTTPDQFVTVINNTAVKIKLDFAYVPFESILAYTIAAIMSPTFDMANLAGLTNKKNMTESMILQANADPGYMANHTCGTGPYQLVEWNHNINVELAEYAGYWGPQPTITNVTIVQSDETANRVASIAAGTADIITINAADATLVTEEEGPFEDWGNTTNEKYANVNVTVGLPAWTVVSMFLNHALEPFDDLNARLGMAYAFPYADFIESAVRGHGKPLHGCIPEGMFGHADVFPYVTNTTKAIAYFKAAGLGLPPVTTAATTTKPTVDGFTLISLLGACVVVSAILRKRYR
jgi:ABC-type transport system substrate-binding protein